MQTNKISHHLQFRLNQALRIFNWNVKIALPAIIVIGLMVAVKLPHSFLYPILFVLVPVSFHFGRKDIPFLKKIFDKSWPFIAFLESAVIYSVLVLINIHYKIDFYAIFGLFFLAVISFFEPRKRTEKVLQLKFISNNLFEWKSYFRQNLVLKIAFYLLLIASCYHTATLIFGALIFADIPAKVFLKNESKEILEKYFSKITFREKLLRNLRFFNLLLLPVYVGFAILNWDRFEILAGYFLFMNLYFLLIFTRKYKVYDHREPENFYSMADTLLNFFFVITVIPAIIFIKNNYRDAEKNIAAYVGN